MIPTEMNPQQKGSLWLSALPDRWLECRVFGHDFEKLRLDGKALKRTRVYALGNRFYQVEVSCPSCRSVRWKTTLYGGVLDRSARYSYRHPDGWSMPVGSGLAYGDFVSEFESRVGGRIEMMAEPMPQDARA